MAAAGYAEANCLGPAGENPEFGSDEANCLGYTAQTANTRLQTTNVTATSAAKSCAMAKPLNQSMTRHN